MYRTSNQGKNQKHLSNNKFVPLKEWISINNKYNILYQLIYNKPNKKKLQFVLT